MTLNRRALFAGGFGAAAAALASKTALAQGGEVYTLSYQSSHPSNQAFTTITGGGFREIVEELSNGRIKFETYDTGALSSVTGMLEAVDQGIIDVSQSYGAFYSGDVPEADVEVGLPFAWKRPWEAYDAYYNRGLREVISGAYETKFNVKHFPAILGMNYGVALRDEISSISDLAGKKIRAVGVYGEYVQQLGASPVVIPGAELYTAMQLGTIDGVLYAAEAVAAASLQDFCKAMIYTPNWNTGVGHWVVNQSVYDSLPEDLQQVIEFASRYGNAAQAMNYQAAEAKFIQVLTGAGMKMHMSSPEELDMLREAAQMTWDQVASRSKAAAQGVEIVRKQQSELDSM